MSEIPPAGPALVDTADGRLRRLAELARAAAFAQSSAALAARVAEALPALAGARRFALLLRRSATSFEVSTASGLAPGAVAANRELAVTEVAGWLRAALGEDCASAHAPAADGGPGALLAAVPGAGCAGAELHFVLRACCAQLALAVDGECRDLAVAGSGARPAPDATQQLALRGLSHDVRSPLQALMMQLDLLASGACGEPGDEQREVLGQMRAGLRRIRDMASAAREAGLALGGALDLDCRPVPVAAVFAGGAARLEAGARERGLRAELGSAPSGEVMADARWLPVLLDALLGNALKFTPAGGVVRFEARRGGGEVAFVVADSGPGVPAALRGRVFDPYVRAAVAGSAPGTGLGLAVARALARQMGGELRLDADGGARFTVSLPAADAPGVSPAAPRADRRR